MLECTPTTGKNGASLLHNDELRLPSHRLSLNLGETVLVLPNSVDLLSPLCAAGAVCLLHAGVYNGFLGNLILRSWISCNSDRNASVDLNMTRA